MYVDGISYAHCDRDEDKDLGDGCGVVSYLWYLMG